MNVITLDELQPIQKHSVRTTMHRYVIDLENNITIYETGCDVPLAEGAEEFKSREELGHLADGWPAARLVEIWNSLPGVVPVSRFTNRAVAVGRVWKVLQCLNPTEAPDSAQLGPSEAAPGRKASAGKKRTNSKKTAQTTRPKRRPKTEPAGREGSKTAKVLTLLRDPEGATLAELMKATGWQPHSVRGFLSGAVGKKMGLAVESSKRDDGQRLYKLAK
jgi:hypothetical protein